MSTGPPPLTSFLAGLLFGLEVRELLPPPPLPLLAVRTREEVAEGEEEEVEAREELVSMEELVSSLIFLRAS